MISFIEHANKLSSNLEPGIHIPRLGVELFLSAVFKVF